jgi:hypothetical protein
VLKLFDIRNHIYPGDRMNAYLITKLIGICMEIASIIFLLQDNIKRRKYTGILWVILGLVSGPICVVVYLFITHRARIAWFVILGVVLILIMEFIWIDWIKYQYYLAGY